jgi:hypothetical protein
MASKKGAKTGQQIGSALGTAAGLLVPGAQPFAGLIGAGASALGGAAGGLMGKNRKKAREEELLREARRMPGQAQPSIDMGIGAHAATQQMMGAPSIDTAKHAIDAQARAAKTGQQQYLADFYAGQRDVMDDIRQDIGQIEEEERMAGGQAAAGIEQALGSPAFAKGAKLALSGIQEGSVEKGREMLHNQEMAEARRQGELRAARGDDDYERLEKYFRENRPWRT